MTPIYKTLIKTVFYALTINSYFISILFATFTWWRSSRTFHYATYSSLLLCVYTTESQTRLTRTVYRHVHYRFLDFSFLCFGSSYRTRCSDIYLIDRRLHPFCVKPLITIYGFQCC